LSYFSPSAVLTLFAAVAAREIFDFGFLTHAEFAAARELAAREALDF